MLQRYLGLIVITSVIQLIYCSRFHCNRGQLVAQEHLPCIDDCFVSEFGTIGVECKDNLKNLYQWNKTTQDLIVNEDGLWSYQLDEDYNVIIKRVVGKGRCLIELTDNKIKMSTESHLLLIKDNSVKFAKNYLEIEIIDGCNVYDFYCNENRTIKTLCKPISTECKNVGILKYAPKSISTYLCNHIYALILSLIMLVFLSWFGLFKVLEKTMLYIIKFLHTTTIYFFMNKLPKCNKCNLVAHYGLCNSHCYCGEKFADSRTLKIHRETCKRSKFSHINKLLYKYNIFTIAFIKLLCIIILLSIIPVVRSQNLSEIVINESTERFEIDYRLIIKILLILIPLLLIIKNISFIMLQEFMLDSIVNNRHSISKILMKFPILAFLQCKWCNNIHTCKKRYDGNCLGICNCGDETVIGHKKSNECFGINRFYRAIMSLNIIEIILLILLVGLPLGLTCKTEFDNITVNNNIDAIAKSITQNLAKELICDKETIISNELCEAIKTFTHSNCEYKGFVHKPFKHCNVSNQFKTITLDVGSLQFNKCLKHKNRHRAKLITKQHLVDLIKKDNKIDYGKLELDTITKQEILELFANADSDFIESQEKFIINGEYKYELKLELKAKDKSIKKITFTNDNVESSFGIAIVSVVQSNIYKYVYSTGKRIKISNTNHELCNGDCPKFNASKNHATFSKSHTSKLSCETIGCFSFDEGCVFGECTEEIDKSVSVFKRIHDKNNIEINICLIDNLSLNCYSLKNRDGLINGKFDIEYPEFKDYLPKLIARKNGKLYVGNINDVNEHEDQCGTPQYKDGDIGFIADLNFDIECHFWKGKITDISSCFKNTFDFCNYLEELNEFTDQIDGSNIIVAKKINVNDKISVKIFTETTNAFQLDFVKKCKVQIKKAYYKNGLIHLNYNATESQECNIETNCLTPYGNKVLFSKSITEILITSICGNKSWVQVGLKNNSIVIKEDDKINLNGIIEHPIENYKHDTWFNCFLDKECKVDTKLIFLRDICIGIIDFISNIPNSFKIFFITIIIILASISLYIQPRNRKQRSIHFNDKLLHKRYRFKNV